MRGLIRLTLLVTALAVAFTALLVILFSPVVYGHPDHESHVRSRSALRSLFSFRDPASFFSPTAIISLTDDNSTIFNAKPAAFGPLLPSRGQSGEIWIGSGFGDGNINGRGITAEVEGELGCSDIPGWSDRDWASDDNHARRNLEQYTKVSITRPMRRRWKADNVDEFVEEQSDPDHPREGDGSDDNLHYPLPRTSISDLQDRDGSGSSWPHANIRSLQESAEISGKIVLLSRGGCGFSEKIKWAQRRGAIAAIVGDNVPGGPLVRMYARGDVSNITIPSIFTSHTTAHVLSSLVPSQSKHAPMSIGNPGPRKSWLSYLKPWKSHPSHAAPQLDEDRIAEHSGPSTNRSEPREGLWVTLTPTDINASPFFNTLFVLIVSPLITLAVVYSMLLLRSRIRRRRWRAPKSVVERLPVRVYHAMSPRTSVIVDADDQNLVSATTPLLGGARAHGGTARPVMRSSAIPIPPNEPSSQYGSLETPSPEQEKMDVGLAEWRRKYGGRQKECVVCLEEYIDGISRVMSLPCGHEFHEDCITPWLTTRRRTCPICKGDVVRSLDYASTDRDGVAHETEEDIQRQAAETANHSPLAAIPVPEVPRRVQSDVERGELFASSYSDTSSPSSSWITRNLNRGLDYVRGYGRNQPRDDTRTDHDQR